MGVFIKLYRSIKRICLIFLSWLTKRVDNCSVMFIPHENGDIDGYDIINYHSDNAYCLFNYMLRDERFEHYIFYLLVSNNELNPKYEAYCKENSKGAKVVFINKSRETKQFFDIFCKCRIIFTTHMFLSFGLKKKEQKVVCLGYFTPFKNDFVWESSQFKDWIRSSNKNYSYHISTSDLSSRILSSDNGLYYNKFLPLGMPRNDLFFNGNNDNLLIHNVLDDFNCFEKIILYTPTYRDYENDDKGESHSIFGYSENVQPLIHVLEKHKAVLVAKLHPLQNRSVIENLHSKNIIAYNSPQNKYSLYDLMYVSDALITDYTSTYFDYLLLNRPVLFNFYDKEKYQKTRGFSISNIDVICAGPIVSSFQELVLEIDNILSGMDSYIDKREWVNALVNLNRDGKSGERIVDFFFK